MKDDPKYTAKSNLLDTDWGQESRAGGQRRSLEQRQEAYIRRKGEPRGLVWQPRFQFLLLALPNLASPYVVRAG